MIQKTGVIILIILVFFVPPLLFTIANTIELFVPWEKADAKRRTRRKLLCISTLLIGLVFSAIWLVLFTGVAGAWYVPLKGFEENFHEIISTEYGLWFYAAALWSLLSVILLRCLTGKRLPPLVSVILIGGVNTAHILCILYFIQTVKHYPNLWLTYVFTYNVHILCVRLVLDEIGQQMIWFREDAAVPQSGISGRIYQLLGTEKRWLIAGLAAVIPAAGMLLIVLIITGQGPSGFVKAFTDTADWTFSQQIPPAPEVYDGHYLCTVAAGGHRRIVRPIRYGVRNGERIIVNRQLLVANAFEDLIAERVPSFHRRVRDIYDRYGYPLSKHITSPTRADIVYILMKPLEWVFLLCLYLFDIKPESRIAIQYTGKTER